MRFGYALIVITVALMVWASSVGAMKTPDAPCAFNSLCTCSSFSADNLGTMKCINVPSLSLPMAVNNSQVYALTMDNTGLVDIDPFFLRSTGLHRLEISNNPFYVVRENAFNGLERSLWELILKSNELIEVPTKSLRNLHKLKTLDLSGNDISFIERGSFRGLQEALENLILADNSISQIPIDAFHGLPKLTSVDLSSNNLREITPDIFREQMNSLERINFADNLLKEIPYSQLAMLRSLKFLDLSSNRIAGFNIEDENLPKDIKLALMELHLEHNEVETAPVLSII